MLWKYSITNAITRHGIFLHLWENRTNGEGITANPLLQPVADAPGLIPNDDRGKFFDFGWNVHPLQILDYLAQSLAWIRLIVLKPSSGSDAQEESFDGVAY